MSTSTTVFQSLLKYIKDVYKWIPFLLVLYVIFVYKVATSKYFATDIFFYSYSFLITIYILSRFLLAHFHKTYPHDDKYFPSVSFIVPAYNEEKNITETIRRFGQVIYPKDKIEIIVINDGSTDNTLLQMKIAENEIRQLGIRMKIISWDQNQGKRKGMAAGIRASTHEIVIFIDSDSFIDKHCVKHLVKYFAYRDVGAVCGHTDVYNAKTNMLTKMQAIRYYIAFRIYKSAESIFGNVTCCPGCCSAYRRAYLMEYLAEWENQRFFGHTCTFGDDRSLTNYMIRKYHAIYSMDAKALTVVPDSFRKYMKQQQRWKKSWVRETIIASSFIWKKHPLGALSFYVYVYLALISPVVFIRALILRPLLTHQFPTAYLLGLLLMLILHGVFYRIEVGDKRWLRATIFFWLNTVILMWQLPWAILTINDTRWGTR